MMAHVLLTVTMRPHVPVKENGVVVTVQVSLYFLHFKLPGFEGQILFLEGR
jgi:hypothetical protein